MRRTAHNCQISIIGVEIVPLNLIALKVVNPSLEHRSNISHAILYMSFSIGDLCPDSAFHEVGVLSRMNALLFEVAEAEGEGRLRPKIIIQHRRLEQVVLNL